MYAPCRRSLPLSLSLLRHPRCCVHLLIRRSIMFYEEGYILLTWMLHNVIRYNVPTLPLSPVFRYIRVTNRGGRERVMKRNGRWRVAQSQLRYYSENHFIPIISNLPAIGRVLCANQPTRVRLLWLDTRWENGRAYAAEKKRREQAIKLLEMRKKLFQYFTLR